MQHEKEKSGKSTIPKEHREEVLNIVDRFNKTILSGVNCYYDVKFRGKYCYLNRYNDGIYEPVFRLNYMGSMDNWDYAIFKWSDERYDPTEFMFPGAGELDGTIEGAMRAGLEAYPISYRPHLF